tara:strand:- start:21 stop:818 length:798 start_codon:yes stop_codon:yes gene_type:complete
MIYLKTYFYVPHEIKFLLMNLIEAYNHIDKFIICEFDRTHTGQPREFIFQDYIHEFPAELRDKILYMPCKIGDYAVEAYEDEDAIHNINEPVMRGFFSKMKSFDDNDIIISIDADEIIYRESYDYIINEVNLNNVVRLNLYQFFYKTTYLWEGKDFVSPIATKYSVFGNHFPCNWRDVGKVVSRKVGCHFSWCMTPEEMVYKLHTYSHPRYRFCADKKVLEKAIKEKEYPFDENVDFSIKELEIDDKVLPECIRTQSPYLVKVQV